MTHQTLPLGLCALLLFFSSLLSAQTNPDCRLQGEINNGIVVGLPASGEVTAQACWFCPTGCGQTGGFSYSFSDDPNDTERLFTCNDIGQNLAEVWVWDAAGYGERLESFVLILDFTDNCQNPQPDGCQPVPVFENGLVMGYGGDGKVQIRARDYDRGSFLSNCPNGTTFSFSFSPDPADSILVIDCEDWGGGTYSVDIWMNTTSGEQTRTEGFLLLALDDECANIPACAPSVQIVNGKVFTMSSSQQVVLKPEDFLLRVYEVCPDAGPYRFSFSPNPEDNRMILTCDYFGQNVIDIWTTNANGQQTNVTTFCLLQLFPESVSCDEPITFPFAPTDLACDAAAADLTPYIDAGLVCANNMEAGAQAGEVAPPNGDCYAQDAWCDGGEVHNSVWFVVTGPAGGGLKVETEGFLDLQLALWQADQCADLLSGNAQLIGANDDRPGDPHGNAALEVGLNPGQTYYLQVDGHGSALEQGPFYLRLSTITSSQEVASTLPQLSLFPNPVAGQFTLQLASPLSEDARLAIYNAQGILVHHQKLESGTATWTLASGHWPAGVYVCQIQTSNGQQLSRRLIRTP